MQRRKLGDSDLEVTPIMLGAWAIGGSMWGGQDEAQAVATIQAALDAGVNIIDTAPVYGLGRSEELVARAIAGRRERVLLATKCGLDWEGPGEAMRFSFTDVDGTDKPVFHNLRPARIRAECEASLRRLRTDRIDLYQIHWPDPTTPLEDSLAELVKLREEGKVRWLGVSNFSPAQLRIARQAGGIVSTQPQYNLLDRAIEAEVLPVCRELGLGVIAYSPMARGLLTGKIGRDHVFPATDHRARQPWFQPERRARILDALADARPIAQAHGISLGNLAIAWALAHPDVTAAIVGARTPEQARENVRASEVRLTAGERARLGELFAGA